MHITNKQERLILLGGDLVVFFLSLWFGLLLRYHEWPSDAVLALHYPPFLLLFSVWIIVFFIGGLYEKHTIILRNRLPALILKVELWNTAIAIAFFYFIPYFGIAPKTNLFIYLVISFALVLLWRLSVYPHLGIRKRQNAMVVGTGGEMRELIEEVNENPRYNLYFISSIDIGKIETLDITAELVRRVYSEDVSVIAVDLRNEKIEPLLPHLYNLIFSRVRFIDMHKIYEDIFDRVPLSLLRYNWFLENISLSPRVAYDLLKRFMDIAIALTLGILSLPLYPFVILAIYLNDKKGPWSVQERIGKGNIPIRLWKFRTMKIANDGGRWSEVVNEVTRVGIFLRNTRLDELPQLWNVVLGDLSLIGPRPEFPEPVKRYEAEVSYYAVRHLIKPGLSGWAQIKHDRHPHHGIDVSETKVKLSYDLYYIKNRSLLLDLKIALQTIKTLLSRSGI